MNYRKMWRMLAACMMLTGMAGVVVVMATPAPFALALTYGSVLGIGWGMWDTV